MPRPAVVVAYAGVCIFWGLSWTFIKIGVQDFPPVLFAAIRAPISALVLAAWVRYAGLPMRLQSSSLRANVLIGILFYGLPVVTTFIGEQTENASVAAVVFGCSPILAVTLARLFLHERLSRTRLLAVLLGVGGILHLYIPTLIERGVRSSVGLLLFLLGAVAGTCGVILAKRYLRRENPATALVWQMGTEFPLVLALSLLLEHPSGAHVTARFIVSLIFLSVFSSGIAYALYFWLLKRLPISQMVYVDFTYPILSIAFARVILAEPLSSRLLISAALIITGGLLASLSAYGRNRRSKESLSDEARSAEIAAGSPGH